MSDVVSALATGEDFQAEGRTWTLSPIGPRVRSHYSRWARMRARESLAEQKADMSTDDYAEQCSSLQAEIAAGAYSWGTPLDDKEAGKAIRVILGGNEGKVKLWQLLLEAKHGELALPRVAEIAANNPEGFALAFTAAMRVAAPNAGAPPSGGVNGQKEAASETAGPTPTSSPR